MDDPCHSTTPSLQLSHFISTDAPQLLTLLHRHSCSANDWRWLYLVLGSGYARATGQRTACGACLILCQTSTSSTSPGLRVRKRCTKSSYFSGASQASMCISNLALSLCLKTYRALFDHMASSFENAQALPSKRGNLLTCRSPVIVPYVHQGHIPSSKALLQGALGVLSKSPGHSTTCSPV